MTVQEGASREEVVALLHKHRIEKVLVVNNGFELRGLITVKDIQKAKDFPKACRDDRERLRVGAAVGTGYDTDERVAALVDAGVDCIVIDTAHGHNDGVSEAVRRFDGGLVVLPHSVRQPSVGERIRGMTRESLERIGVPLVIAG